MASLKKVAKFSKFTVSINTDTDYTHGWMAQLPDGFHWGFSTARCRAFESAVLECGTNIVPEIVILDKEVKHAGLERL